jgi:hypothetical protein
MVRLITLGLAAFALAWGVAVLAMPDAVGRHLLGATWPLAAPLVGIFVLLAVSQAMSLGPGQGLRVLAAARRTLGTQLVGVALLLLAAPVGVLVGGARGAALAMAVAVALTTALRWQQFTVAYAQARRGVDPNRFPR